MEMMRHPEETTNMRRQTVASYFRVGFSPFHSTVLQPTERIIFLLYSFLKPVFFRINYEAEKNPANVNKMTSFCKIIELFVSSSSLMDVNVHALLLASKNDTDVPQTQAESRKNASAGYDRVSYDHHQIFPSRKLS